MGAWKKRQALLMVPLLLGLALASAADDAGNDTSSSGAEPGAAWSTAPAGSEQDLLKWALAHSDPEELRRIAKEVRQGLDAGSPEFLERQGRVQALLQQLKEEPTEAELMQEAVSVLVNASSTQQQLRNALEALRYLVEPIDNANNLQGMGGLAPLVALLGASQPPALQSSACYVLGTACSNNHEFQAHLLQSHPEVLQLLLALVVRGSSSGGDGSAAGAAGSAAGGGSGGSTAAAGRGEGQHADGANEAARERGEAGLKALYALSAILRLNPSARASFYGAAGVHALQQLLGSAGAGVAAKKKAISLLTDLIHLDAPAMSSGAAAAAAAAEGGGSSAAAPQAAALDFPAAVAAALQLLDAEQQPLVVGAGADWDLQEKALLALLALLDGQDQGQGQDHAEGLGQGQGSPSASSGAAAAELIADAGGLAMLRRLQASLAESAAAEAAAGGEEDGEGGYAEELLGLVRRVQRHVGARAASGSGGSTGRDVSEL